MAGALAEADTKTGLTVDDLVALGETDLRGVVALSGRAQRVLDALNTRAARALKILEGSGSGPAADDVLRGEGKMSRKKAKRQAGRADTAERFPEVGKAIDAAEANAENIDMLAKVTEDLSPGELERMNALGTEIASYASSSSPEQFARYIKRLVANIKDPLPGASIAERQKAASRLSLKTRV